MKYKVEFFKTGEDDIANVIGEGGENAFIQNDDIINGGIERAALEIEQHVIEKQARAAAAAARVSAIEAKKVEFAGEKDTADIKIAVVEEIIP